MQIYSINNLSAGNTFKGISGKGYSKNLNNEIKKINREIEQLEKQRLEKISEIYHEDDSVLANQKIKELDIIKNAYLALIRKVKSLIPKPPLDINFKDGFGFDKIAGYNDVKNQLNTHFFNQLCDEKNCKKVEIPNAFIFFGPYGTGKSTFARALAEQMTLQPEIKSNFVEVNGVRKDSQKVDFVTELENIAKNSLKNYDNNGRTVVYIDEFTENNLASVPEANIRFSKLLSEFSEKYKCTAFLTTNHLSKHNLNLKEINPVYVALDLPNYQNMSEVLKYYIQRNNLEKSKIDYIQLSKELINNAKTRGYYLNNTNLYNLADTSTKKFTQKTSYEEIMNCANNFNDEYITQQSLNEFTSDVKITNKTAYKALA